MGRECPLRVADHVAELMGLLGSDVILIACRRGTKKPVGPWKGLGVECMKDPGHLARLNRGVNIGVVLGRRSGGLCSLDIDSDDGLNEFVRENEPISDTLITRGNRGGNVWWRVKGDCPGLTPLKVQGLAWGEWRGDGAQTVIHGQHPAGAQYRMLRRKPPREIEFKEIRWPEGTTPILLSERTPMQTVTETLKRTELAERTELTEQPEIPEHPETTEAHTSGVCVAVAGGPVLSLEDALALTVPKAINQNHELLFLLDRWVKGVEDREGRKRTLVELRQVFDSWLAEARPFLRKEQTEDEYWFEFLEGYERARFGLGVNPVVRAWELARRNGPPTAAGQFKDEGLRMLVALCHEMWLLSGRGQFFLSARTVQRVLGLGDHVRAARWLKGLVRTRILSIVEAGGQETRKATRYTYLPED